MCKNTIQYQKGLGREEQYGCWVGRHVTQDLQDVVHNLSDKETLLSMSAAQRGAPGQRLRE